MLLSVRPRAQRAAAVLNWQLKRHAATLFFRFFKWTTVHDCLGPRPGVAVGGGNEPGTFAADAGPPAAAADGSASAPAAGDMTVGGLGGAPAMAPTLVPWHKRMGTCDPRFDPFFAAGTEWASIRPFILALLGDPVVNLFAGQPRAPPRALAKDLEKEDGGQWRQLSTASNAVGFMANVFARVGPLLNKERAPRKAFGALLLFVVDVDAAVDRDFESAAEKASSAGQTETLEFCRRWLGVTTHEEYKTFAAEHPDFMGEDLESPYKKFEYFGFLKRVRPAIFTPREKPRKGTRRKQACVGGARKGSQAALEDAGDRCSNSFPKHSQLTAGVFNIV